MHGEHLFSITLSGKFTNIHQGLKRGWNVCAGPGNRNGYADILIIYSDGRHNENKHLTISMANHIKSKGIHIICVAVNNLKNVKKLRQIASKPEWVFQKDDADFENLATLIEELSALDCTCEYNMPADKRRAPEAGLMSVGQLQVDIASACPIHRVL